MKKLAIALATAAAVVAAAPAAQACQRDATVTPYINTGAECPPFRKAVDTYGGRSCLLMNAHVDELGNPWETYGEGTHWTRYEGFPHVVQLSAMESSLLQHPEVAKVWCDTHFTMDTALGCMYINGLLRGAN